MTSIDHIVSLARPLLPFFFVVAEERVWTSSLVLFVLTLLNVLINCIIATENLDRLPFMLQLMGKILTIACLHGQVILMNPL